MTPRPQAAPGQQPVSFPTAWQSKPGQEQPKTALAQPYPPVPVQKEPIFRAKIDEESYTPPAGAKQSVSLSLPSPDALDIGTTSAPMTAQQAAVDWNSTRARLNQLGAVSFNLVKLGDGAYRMAIALPTANSAQNHMVEVVAGSEAQAVATALQRAEQWAKK